MNLSREEFFEIFNDFSNIVHEKVIDSTKWGSLNELVFKKDGKFYKCEYETLPEDGIQFYDDFIDYEEVFPVEVTSIKYLTVKQIEKRNQK